MATHPWRYRMGSICVAVTILGSAACANSQNEAGLAQSRASELATLAAVPTPQSSMQSPVPKVAASPGASPSPAGPFVVALTEANQFDPPALTIHPNSQVMWKNMGQTQHTVTDDKSKAKVDGDADLPNGAQPFDSGPLQLGDTYTQTFTTPGKYIYVSLPQEQQGMLGVIVVLQS